MVTIRFRLSNISSIELNPRTSKIEGQLWIPLGRVCQQLLLLLQKSEKMIYAGALD